MQQVKVKEEMKNRFLVGSTYFFAEYLDFKSKDIDIVILIDNPKNFKTSRQTTLFNKKCVFEWKRMSAEEFVKLALETNLPMQVGKFLVPEFTQEINFTLAHLKQLEKVFNKLDEKHLYEKVIYNAYIENNDFILTDKQRDDAYNMYKKYR